MHLRKNGRFDIQECHWGRYNSQIISKAFLPLAFDQNGKTSIQSPSQIYRASVLLVELHRHRVLLLGAVHVGMIHAAGRAPLLAMLVAEIGHPLGGRGPVLVRAAQSGGEIVHLGP